MDFLIRFCKATSRICVEVREFLQCCAQRCRYWIGGCETTSCVHLCTSFLLPKQPVGLRLQPPLLHLMLLVLEGDVPLPDQGRACLSCRSIVSRFRTTFLVGPNMMKLSRVASDVGLWLQARIFRLNLAKRRHTTRRYE